MNKSLKIFGSTGSIGVSCLNVLKLKNGDFSLKLLAAGNNLELLKKQIEQFNPEYATIHNREKRESLKRYLKETVKSKTKYVEFEESFSIESDITVSAIVGSAGLMPTFKSIPHTKRLALANKESIVLAGEFILEECKKHGTELIPIDSEHNAVHQAIRAGKEKEVKNVILTASGGPFFGKKAKDLEKVTVEDALNHPTWNMGSKITIDSATLMNKGLEVIEARFLFEVDYPNIKVKIHPQSVIHSMVEFIDGSIICQMGKTDMMLPIQYALYYPDRINTPEYSFDFSGDLTLTFHEPDTETFKCLKLAYQCGEKGISDRIILNASNEIAVDAFLKKEIKFTDIPKFIEKMLNTIKRENLKNVEDVLKFNEKIKIICNKEVKGGNF